MIKLVVSDLDGTLLKKGESLIPADCVDAIHNLQSRGIVFAVASGRRYEDLYNIMRQSSSIYYICSDGGCVVYKGEVLYKQVIDNTITEKYKNRTDFSFHKAPNTQSAVKIIKQGAHFTEAPMGCFEIYSDKDWREWIKNGTSKGAATEFLQNRLNIRVSETVAIGDNLNDLSLLRRAGEKYIIKDSTLHKRSVYGRVISDISCALRSIGQEVD